MKVPYLPFGNIHQDVKAELTEAFKQVLDSNWYILGSRLKSFEKAFAKYCQASECVGTANGFDAICLSLRALGIGAGDEVIVAAHTFVASVMAIQHAGATPVLADVNEDDYLISRSCVEKAITPKTKAILAVHLYGLPCDMNSLTRLAHEHNIHIIEDFAQAHGARYKDKSVGSFGIINATSFYPVKNLGALGDGGAVTTNKAELAERVRSLRNYGGQSRSDKDETGVNSRLDELQASLLSVKLKYLDRWNGERIRQANGYMERLNGTGDLTFQSVDKRKQHVYHVLTIRTKRRDNLQDYLNRAGVQTMIHYEVPVFRQKALSTQFTNLQFPVSECLANELLSLPIQPGLTQDQIDFVCDSITNFYNS